MAETDLIWMTLLVFVPSAFALALMLFPRGSEKAMCWWSLIGTAVTLGISIAIFIGFRQDTVEGPNVNRDPAQAGKASLDYRVWETDRQEPGSPEARKANDWAARYPWIGRFNIEYFLGIDGISMPLILLTTFLCFLSMLASFHIKRYEGKERFVRGYCMLFLVLETGMLGTFVALDFFLFYIFWEVMLLPMYFLIGVWGGPRREYAAIKFFLYTLLGSVFILIALIGFYFSDMRDFVNPEVAKQAEKRVKQAQPLLSDAEVAKRAGVRTFDLVALARAGRACLQWLETGDVKKVTAAPNLEKARADLARAQLGQAGVSAEVGKQRKALAATIKELEDARAALAAAEAADKPDAEIKPLQTRVEGLEAKAKPFLDAEARAKDSTGNFTKLTADVARMEAGLKSRLETEVFFTPVFQYTMFIFLLIGFAIKVPVFPFHTWLPDAHVEAPTPISMILAGVLLKLGGYGILRIAYPICPWAAYQLASGVALFGVISIVYGAFAAMAQTDFKKLVAYSSVSHMGYVLLGIAVWSTSADRNAWSLGMNGAMFQMIAHGITSAGMFFLVGVIYDRAHHRNLDNFRGLYEPMPFYGGISAVIFFAAMGLPGMCGFIGEVMVVLATWKFAPGGQQWIGITFAVLSALTVVLTAAYILWTIQRVFMGTNEKYAKYPDITPWELTCAIPLVILAVALGVLPQMLLLDWMEPSVTHLVDSLVSFKP